MPPFPFRSDYDSDISLPWSLRPATAHRRRLASPNLPSPPPSSLLPSASLTPPHPFLTLLIVICQPGQCPAPALHHCAPSSLSPSLPPSACYKARVKTKVVYIFAFGLLSCSSTHHIMTIKTEAEKPVMTYSKSRGLVALVTGMES